MDKERLRDLESALANEIHGQSHLLPRIASAVRRGQLGLTHPARPRGSFLLLGPTGVGKTETALVTTQHVFGDGAVFRFDMSEFQNQDSVGRLLGATEAERGFLGAVRERTVEGSLLFDEIEKAHPKVLDLFLQLLDAARITVATGETLDFQGFYIWMTSNLGGAEITSLQHGAEASAERHVLTTAEGSLRPELFARVSEKLVFRKLDYDHQIEVAQKFLNRELEFLKTRGHHLQVGPEIMEFLVRKGFHPKLGARPMRDAVEGFVGDAVAQAILDGRPTSGHLAVDPVKDLLVVSQAV